MSHSGQFRPLPERDASGRPRDHADYGKPDYQVAMERAERERAAELAAFDSEWKRCTAWLEAALEHAGGTHGIGDVRRMVENGEARFWPSRNCAVVTLIMDYPRLRLLHVWLAGGDLDELLNEMEPLILAWGRDERGCRRMTLTGRPGWERAMKPMGYAPAARTLTKELTP